MNHGTPLPAGPVPDAAVTRRLIHDSADTFPGCCLIPPCRPQQGTLRSHARHLGHVRPGRRTLAHRWGSRSWVPAAGAAAPICASAPALEHAGDLKNMYLSTSYGVQMNLTGIKRVYHQLYGHLASWVSSYFAREQTWLLQLSIQVPQISPPSSTTRPSGLQP